ncbi:FadR/GntR family transcriptional regulator [Candidatus Bipolaricaulota sp. J31]
MGSGRKRRSTEVLEWIVRELQGGRYREGDRFPTERELAERLSVSRSSIREALSILSAFEILERRVGNGTYVRCSDPRVLRTVLHVARSEEGLRETFELQRILEVGVAELAASKATPADIAAIEDALARMEEAARRSDIEAYFSADRCFHLAIVHTTGNPLLEGHIRDLISRMDRPLWRAVKRYYLTNYSEYLRRSLEDHRRLLEAISARDPARARRVMTEHFSRIEAEIFREDETKGEGVKAEREEGSATGGAEKSLRRW